MVWRDGGFNPGVPDHWRTLYRLGQWAGFKVWNDLRLNPGVPDHWRTLYPLGQWAVHINDLSSFICLTAYKPPEGYLLLRFDTDNFHIVVLEIILLSYSDNLYIVNIVLRNYTNSIIILSSGTVICIYLAPPYKKYVNQGQFLSRVYQVWFHFPLPWTGCRTKVKEPCLFKYLPITREWIFRLIPFKEYSRNVQCKQPCPGFEIGLLWPFQTTITITTRVPPYSYIVSSILF